MKNKAIHNYANGINQHLFTWVPMNIGYLFKYSGYQMVEIEVIEVLQPPFSGFMFKYLGVSGYNFVGRVYRALRYSITNTIKNIGASANILIAAKK